MVSVVGSGKELSAIAAALAEALGAAIVKAGWGVITGGGGGVMEAVSRGAVAGRGAARYPPVVGVLPSYDAASGNGYLDVALPTGLGYARNALVAAAGDALVCIGGATGALSEVALARKLGKPVLVFAQTGGTASLAARAIPAVIAVGSVPEAIAKLKELLA
jgi:uncharacterized protein (TIGR00725 family)